jgi:predicted nucleic acid-binding protein
MASSDLDAALGSRERILLDTSTLIGFHSTHEAVYPLADHLMRRIERSGDPLHGYFSAISAAELLVRPIRTGTENFTSMQAFLTGYPHLTVLPADLHVAAQAANIRALTRLPLADAFIIATGLVSGCEAIVSNDERWKRRLEPIFPAFRWLYLGDYVETQSCPIPPSRQKEDPR